MRKITIIFAFCFHFFLFNSCSDRENHVCDPKHTKVEETSSSESEEEENIRATVTLGIYDAYEDGMFNMNRWKLAKCIFKRQIRDIKEKMRLSPENKMGELRKELKMLKIEKYKCKIKINNFQMQCNEYMFENGRLPVLEENIAETEERRRKYKENKIKMDSLMVKARERFQERIKNPGKFNTADLSFEEKERLLEINTRLVKENLPLLEQNKRLEEEIERLIGELKPE